MSTVDVEEGLRVYYPASNGSPNLRVEVRGLCVEAFQCSDGALLGRWNAEKVWVAPAYEVLEGLWATEGNALLLELPQGDKVWLTGTMGVEVIRQPGIVVDFASENIANNCPHSVVATQDSFWFLPSEEADLCYTCVAREAFEAGISAREALHRYRSYGFDYDGFAEESLDCGGDSETDSTDSRGPGMDRDHVGENVSSEAEPSL